jgi:hypothetical protein
MVSAFWLQGCRSVPIARSGLDCLHGNHLPTPSALAWVAGSVPDENILNLGEKPPGIHLYRHSTSE